MSVWLKFLKSGVRPELNQYRPFLPSKTYLVCCRLTATNSYIHAMADANINPVAAQVMPRNVVPLVAEIPTSLPCLLTSLTILDMITLTITEAMPKVSVASFIECQQLSWEDLRTGQHTKESKWLARAAICPPENTAGKAPIRARPVAATPTQYKTNMTLLAIFTARTASFIADGQRRSARLMPGFSSF